MQNKLIAQGFECYWNGAVNQFIKIEATTYQAMITIEENHIVTLKLDDSGAIFWRYCKCYCSHSPYCKHIATAYAAQQHQNSSTR